MIAYLLHTSPQWYSLDMWERSVMLVHAQTRGFKVAMAFKFEKRVLAFLSNDLVFTPSLLDGLRRRCTPQNAAGIVWPTVGSTV
uniref:Uncharacterized protein n=1 Tax=Mycena chlorophos TaxID=658473 RepID=A0ABQ0LNW5_MYCCL|nr:predicted protein [Mycena chlorophos]